MSKFVIVTGGVVSSLGKGITAASLGRLLISRGLKVAVQKLDPYINVDPGTMSPYQHGEVFVTDDGTETDLDIGHYERFLDICCDKNCNYTSGKIYSTIIQKERAGEYLGRTIQVVPHVTNEIKDKIKSVASPETDVVIVEIGGTVGDIEGLSFLEAVRQLRGELGSQNVLFLHVALLPYLEAAKEIKTKPAQSSVKELTRLGIQPDILVCRTNAGIEIDDEMKEKLAMFCNLRGKEYVIHNADAKCLYEVPLMLQKEGLDTIVCKQLKLKTARSNMTEWKQMVKNIEKKKKQIEVAIVGKYTAVPDAYISVTEALKHAGIANNVDVKVRLVSSIDIEEKGAAELLQNVKGIVVPGGFGTRGIEGKIQAAKYARENNIPYLGLCLGMQIAVIEFARDVLGYADATSAEFNPETKHNVIDIMEEQKKISNKGGTMRLGAYPCKLKKGTKAYEAYGTENISERHRHRYEFNNKFKKEFEDHGMIASGINTEQDLVEIVEIPSHKFFVASQFHPEFKSHPYRSQPLFKAFIAASIL
jgi:CTP synthase